MRLVLKDYGHGLWGVLLHGRHIGNVRMLGFPAPRVGHVLAHPHGEGIFGYSPRKKMTKERAARMLLTKMRNSDHPRLKEIVK